MMSVSVIIPCYKDARTLKAALNSVFTQTRAVDEIIVINDCSPESESIEAIIKQYPSVKYLKNQTNKGLAATRNIGIQAATSSILTFLDADDELHPQKIEFQLSVFSREVAVSCHVRRTSFEQGNISSITYDESFSTKIYCDSREIIRKNRLTGASIMASRELLQRLGGYDETLRSCEDFDLWLRILDADTKVIDIQLPLYLYRLNLEGLSRNHLLISAWELTVVESYLLRYSTVFLASKEDAQIWAYWLIKHLLRYELCLNPTLRERTRENIERLNGHFILLNSLRLLQRVRLLKPAAGLLRLLQKARRH